MKTTQGWGWLAAGVLALGLNSIYQDNGGAAWAHRVADGVVAQVSERAEMFADLAMERIDRLQERITLAGGRDETASCRLATAMARVQSKIARTQHGMGRLEEMS